MNKKDKTTNTAKKRHLLAFKKMRAGQGTRGLTTTEGHRVGGQSGTLRAAIFGINDGLVSNLSLVMGVVSASTDSRFVLLAGVAGLLAGAFSMGAGEYVSMSAQRELFENQIAIERRELAEDLQGEHEELALIYRDKGMSPDEAVRLATKMMANLDIALDTHVREELGLNPDELGSAWGAALSSFVAFVLGAIVPVMPYIFFSNPTALILSVGLSGLALFGVGAALSIFTGRYWLYSGVRMLLIGGIAAVVTYLVGRVVGVSTGL